MKFRISCVLVHWIYIYGRQYAYTPSWSACTLSWYAYTSLHLAYSRGCWRVTLFVIAPIVTQNSLTAPGIPPGLSPCQTSQDQAPVLGERHPRLYSCDDLVYTFEASRWRGERWKVTRLRRIRVPYVA